MNKNFLGGNVDVGGAQGKYSGEKGENVQKHETQVKIC